MKGMAASAVRGVMGKWRQVFLSPHWLPIIVATILFMAGRASAQTAPGVTEIRAALAAIQNRCPAEAALASRGALKAMMIFMDMPHNQPLPKNTNVENFYERLLRTYPDTDERELARFAILGMLKEVDFVESTTVFRDRPPPGHTAGVGLELQQREDGLFSLSPLRGFPAEDAGLKNGDILVTIDDQPTLNLTLDQIVRLLRGPVGAVLNISVVRVSESRPLTFKITRVPIEITSVESRLEGTVAIVRISLFDHNTVRQLREAIAATVSSATNGYVLDLRGNSGGLLEAVVEAADLFLEEGPIGAVVSERECPPTPTQIYVSTPGDEAMGRPIILLTSNATGSGAELFTMALVQRQRAITVGERTFGADTVTTALMLSERSAMELVTGRLTGPNGDGFGGGLEPNIAVNQSASDEDKVLEAAIKTLLHER